MAGPTTLFQTGIHSARPAASAGCVLYSCTTHSLVYRSDGSAWTTFLTLPSGSSSASPALTFGTSAAAGAASTFVATDATLPIFDATAPVTQAFGDAAATGSAAFAARRDHKHGMPAFTTVYADAAADVNLAADTMTDVASISLPAGTWDVDGWITFTGNTSYSVQAITDSSNVVLGEMRGAPINGAPTTWPVSARVTPGSTSTYKLRAQSNGAADVQRFGVSTGPGTRIRATRVA